MKEVQNSELLEILRKKCEAGEEKLEKALKEAGENSIHISGWFFRRETILECKNTLAQARMVNSLKEMKSILKEDTIPLSLLYEEFWNDFQNSIDEIH